MLRYLTKTEFINSLVVDILPSSRENVGTCITFEFFVLVFSTGAVFKNQVGTARRVFQATKKRRPCSTLHSYMHFS
jgi:hypothetical protein